MKHLIILSLILFSSSLYAAEKNKINETYIEFAKIMGLHQLIESSMKQTEESMKKQMSSLLPNIYQKIPDLTKKDKEELNKIVNKYLASIPSLINIEQATNIYITELVKNMSEEEIEYATNFYRSEKGKKAQQTVIRASQQLQTYFRTQIENANRKNHPIFMDELEAFMNSAYE